MWCQIPFWPQWTSSGSKVTTSRSQIGSGPGKLAYSGNTSPTSCSCFQFSGEEGALRLRGERVRDGLPGVDEGVGRRQMQHDAPHRHCHVRTELEQPLAQRLHL